MMIAALLAASAALAVAGPDRAQCSIQLIVLGAAQDAGIPQIGQPSRGSARQFASSLALVDRRNGKRYLFDASPDLREQLSLLDGAAPARPSPMLGIDGIFLTHAHIGHYAGLMFLGRESANTAGVVVHAMPRMGQFLSSNGPWSQLVSIGNIKLEGMTADHSVKLDGGISVTPIRAPHRDEFSETVGFRVETPGDSFFYLPDIDRWAGWPQSVPQLLATTGHLFVDATFFDDNELPDRDMRQIPHPRVVDTMRLLKSVPTASRARLHFIHFNNSNPIRDPASAQSRSVSKQGFSIARQGQTLCLDARDRRTKG